MIVGTALVRNALVATGDIGEIVFRTKVNGPIVEIYIADTGPGIQPEMVERLFKKPVQSSAQRQQTGRGLWLASSIVKYHGGEISLVETGRQGTTFVIRLPIENQGEHRARILVVENDLQVARATAQILIVTGYDVTTAVTVNEAKERVSSSAFDLLILGLRLVNDFDSEDLSGLLLAKEPSFRKIPKVLLSAYLTSSVVRDALSTIENGNPVFQEVVSKSDGPQELLDAVSRALSKSQVRVDVRIDFENLLFGLRASGFEINSRTLIDAIKAAIANLGQIIRIVVYADWHSLRRTEGRDLKSDLNSLGVDTVDTSPRSARNFSDMRLSADILDLLQNIQARKDIDILVLASGDGDLRPIVETALQRGLRVIILSARASFSHSLASSTNEVRYVDDFLHREKPDQSTAT